MAKTKKPVPEIPAIPTGIFDRDGNELAWADVSKHPEIYELKDGKTFVLTADEIKKFPPIYNNVNGRTFVMMKAEAAAFEKDMAVVSEPKREDFERALDDHLNAIAITAGYSNAADFVSYTTSAVKAWSESAETFVIYRDHLWQSFETEWPKIEKSKKPLTVGEYIAGLPKFKG